MTLSIGLLGDVMLGRAVAKRLNQRPGHAVWGEELLTLTASLDLVIANLECCLASSGRPTRRIPRKPFFFRGSPSATAQLRQLNIRAVGLANNHALDYEERALWETLAALEHADIAVAGAGRGSAARCPAVVLAGRARVGLLAIADHPAEYAAQDGRIGIAYADLRRELPAWMWETLGALRASCDAVIAFPHWGPNMARDPQPWQRRRAREMQAAGAQLVAGHSAHVFHGVAWGVSGPILTDLGDALDDYRVDADLRNDLGLLAIWRPGSTQPELELVGLRLRFAFTDLARGSDADWIAERLEQASTTPQIERVAEQRFLITP